MYSNLKSTQYLISMLKKRGINHVVISPGTSHNPIVRCMDEDPFFITHSVTDERSAAFFAIGLIQELQTPVVILSTSGTATCNYVSGMTEAFYRHLPLIAVTADKNPFYLDQMEEQMIDQRDMYRHVCKAEVSLPIVRDSKDEWYCKRLLNEAFLALNHHGTGPVHINVPIDEGIFAMGSWFNTPELPDVPLIRRYDLCTEEPEWEALFHGLRGKKIVLLCGQDISFSETEAKLFDQVAHCYNCIISVDTLTNLRAYKTVRTHKGRKHFLELAADVVITLNGNIVTDFKHALKYGGYRFEHWHVAEDGCVADPFRQLTTIVELSTVGFLKKMLQYGEQEADDAYYQQWVAAMEDYEIPELPYSLSYACQAAMAAIPPNSILHLGNSTTIRVAQFFEWDSSVKIYCNRGKHGIDGSMSSFIGQASVTDKTAFLLIGDLSFFYDMNALWNRYQGKNIRIMLFNNGGASLFHYNQGLPNYPLLNNNVAAEHTTTAEGWCRSQGYDYLCSKNKEEFDANLPLFTSTDSEKPIIFEVFTDKALDGDLLHVLQEANAEEVAQNRQYINAFKNKVKATRLGRAVKAFIQ